MNISFTIPGPPRGKQRARITRRGFSYTLAETTNYETLVRYGFVQVTPTNFQPYDGPVEIDIRSVHPIPASWSKKKRLAAEAGGMHCRTKPDWDNIGKIVCDALNGVAFTDDARVVSARIRKFYGTVPATHVTITFLDGSTVSENP